MTPIIAPYGTWTTPLPPDILGTANLRLSHPTILPDGAFAWVEGRPAEGGRQAVVRRRPSSPTEDMFPIPFNARARVHEDGGRPYVFVGDDLYFTNFSDQQMFRAGSPPERLVAASNIRIAEPIHDSRRHRLIAVGERHDGNGYPANGLVSIHLGPGKIDWLLGGHDFFAAPALSRDGTELAYLAWDHPHMPWDAAAVYVAPILSEGSLGASRHIAGGSDGSAFQPTWSPRGELYFALESSSFPWTLHRFRDGQVSPIAPSRAEWGAPYWGLGTTLYGFSSDHEIVGAVMDQGLMRIVRLDTEGRVTETLTEKYTHIGQLFVRGRAVLFTVGWAGAGTQLIHLDLETRSVDVVRSAFDGLLGSGDTTLSAGDISNAEPIAFDTTDGDRAFGFFYPPTSSHYAAAESERPPLLVLCHGGPTGCANPTLQLSIQHWTTQGFAVLDVNYRGSTGFGRDYREKLRGRWGVVDVDDCVCGALSLAKDDRVDRARLLIRGGSAGGFTVLMALCRYPNVFAAAACLYGVSDPRSLANDTHKFESHYDRYLFGDAEARERAFVERAPLSLADRIVTPVIFFQGLEDRVVPPSQTEGLHAVLRKRGIETEYHGYPGEQHGFRRAETIADVYSKERAFYQRIMYRKR